MTPNESANREPIESGACGSSTGHMLMIHMRFGAICLPAWFLSVVKAMIRTIGQW